MDAAAAAARSEENARAQIHNHPLHPNASHGQQNVAPNLELLAVEAQHQQNHVGGGNTHPNHPTAPAAVPGVVDISNTIRVRPPNPSIGKPYPQLIPKSEVLLTSAPMVHAPVSAPMVPASSSTAANMVPKSATIAPAPLSSTMPMATSQHMVSQHRAGPHPIAQQPTGPHPRAQAPHPNAAVPLAPDNVELQITRPSAAPIAPGPEPLSAVQIVQQSLPPVMIPNIPVPAGSSSAAAASAAANGNGKTLEPLRAVVKLVSQGHGTAQDVFDESDKYAEVCKRRERDKIKEKEPDTVSKSDKLRNRSRREAKVTKVKQREYQRALQLAIHWLVEEAKNNT